MTSGVYMIRNTHSGKRYIGSSRNIEARWATHRNQLNGTWSLRHRNRALRDDWARYGEAAFEFVVIEEMSSVDALVERENYWIEHTYEEGIYNKIRRAVEPRMREIVQAVANGEAVWYDTVGKHCGFCDVVMDETHAAGCLVTKARDILGQ